MYKDPDKQREANRQAKRRQRAKDDEPQGMTIAEAIVAENVIPKTDIRVIPKQNSIRTTELREFEAVAGPSVAEPWTDGTKQPRTLTADKPTSDSPKRGKDIKVFADLPPHVQDRISRMKTGVRFKEIETNRAIKYEQFITTAKPKSQSHSPMMVGYVPPEK